MVSIECLHCSRVSRITVHWSVSGSHRLSNPTFRECRSTQYLDYEKLKGELKRAKASAVHRDEVLKRMPPLAAAEVAQELKNREAGLSSVLEARDACKVPVASSNGSIENTPLLGGGLKRTNSWAGLYSSNLNNTVFKVTSYLGLADDRELFIKAYIDANDKLDAFVRTYEQEVGAPFSCCAANKQIPFPLTELLTSFISAANDIFPLPGEEGARFLRREDG